jgi:hypothetical protein
MDLILFQSHLSLSIKVRKIELTEPMPIFDCRSDESQANGDNYSLFRSTWEALAYNPVGRLAGWGLGRSQTE